jgi:8-oxo-dGTP diphosphatase
VPIATVRHHGRFENWAVNLPGVTSGLRQTPITSFLDLAWRTAFRLAFPLARIWWRLTRPRHEGVVVAVYVGSTLLLVRSSYRRGWHLPGGGVRLGEIPETAARRELAEEIGLRASELLPAGFTCGIWDGRRDRVHIFELRLVELPQLQLDNREVIAARLTSRAELQSMVLTGPTAAYLGKVGQPFGCH